VDVALRGAWDYMLAQASALQDSHPWTAAWRQMSHTKSMVITSPATPPELQPQHHRCLQCRSSCRPQRRLAEFLPSLGARGSRAAADCVWRDHVGTANHCVWNAVPAFLFAVRGLANGFAQLSPGSISEDRKCLAEDDESVKRPFGRGKAI
jgi:hypothetical protein